MVAVAMRGSHVTTTFDDDRFCGAIVVDGFGSELLTGRQTQANIFLIFILLHTHTHSFY